MNKFYLLFFLLLSCKFIANYCLYCRYIVQDMLGQGTFGQVFKCSVEGSSEMVAVKVIKNQAAYYHQARVEIGILQFLNTRADPLGSFHIVRLKDFFLHKRHLCLVFELLNLNLFELVRHNKFRGLSLDLVRIFMSQLLDTLSRLHQFGIVHCDIKPENVLLASGISGEVKLIDFGSACFAGRTMYTYVQSRFYRSPEVVLGNKYDMAVDMWSLGCVAAELFLGLPLFPAAGELDLLSRMTDVLGPLPDRLIVEGKHAAKYYKEFHMENLGCSYRLRTPQEFCEITGKTPAFGKQYFAHKSLTDIIHAYPLKADLSEAEISRERRMRAVFIDFLLGLLTLDPSLRWSPDQARSHPFIRRGTQLPRQGQQTTDRINEGTSNPACLPSGVEVGRHPQGMEAMMNNLTNVWLASSPQMHAQAHAAAMAAVHAQMLQSKGSWDVHSSATNSVLHSPPSRSFGPHLQMAAMQMPSPSFNSFNERGVLPLLRLSEGSWRSESTARSFVPSSMKTYSNLLSASKTQHNQSNSSFKASTSSVEDRTPPGRAIDEIDDLMGSIPLDSGVVCKRFNTLSLTNCSESAEGCHDQCGEEIRENEDSPNPGDWDPLWNEALLQEDSSDPNEQFSHLKQRHQSKDQKTSSPALALAARYINQLKALHSDGKSDSKLLELSSCPPVTQPVVGCASDLQLCNDDRLRQPLQRLQGFQLSKDAPRSSQKARHE